MTSLRKNMTFAISLFCILYLIISCKKETETKVPHYDFINPAYLDFEFANSTDSVYVHSWHWNYILMNEIITDSQLILGNGKMVLVIKVNRPQLVKFLFNDTRIDFFLVPTDTTNIFIDFSRGLDSLKPEFSGKLALMNQYYFEKHQKFDTWDFFYARAMFTQTSVDAIELQKNNDELTKLELGFLDEFRAKNKNLDEWFYEYEKQNNIFGASYFKINSIFYRDFMLGIKDSIPKAYYDFTDSLDLNSEISFLGDNYFLYLSELLSWQFKSGQNIKMDTNEKKNQGQNYYDQLSCFISELDPPARELFSLYNLFFYNLHKPDYLIYVDTLKYNIVSPEYKHMFDSIMLINNQLVVNSKAPEFYLQDINGKYWSLKDFRGKVVMLDFWSIGCLPCLKEFPFEDTLVEELKNTDFQLINICLKSDIESWKTKIEGHNKNIVQLLAIKNWNDLLEDNYKIYGYPTFVLIDKKGMIVNADPPRPSNPELIEEIRRLLEIE